MAFIRCIGSTIKRTIKIFEAYAGLTIGYGLAHNMSIASNNAYILMSRTSQYPGGEITGVDFTGYNHLYITLSNNSANPLLYARVSVGTLAYVNSASGTQTQTLDIDVSNLNGVQTIKFDIYGDVSSANIYDVTLSK